MTTRKARNFSRKRKNKLYKRNTSNKKRLNYQKNNGNNFYNLTKKKQKRRRKQTRRLRAKNNKARRSIKRNKFMMRGGTESAAQRALRLKLEKGWTPGETYNLGKSGVHSASAGHEEEVYGFQSNAISVVGEELDDEVLSQSVRIETTHDQPQRSFTKLLQQNKQLKTPFDVFLDVSSNAYEADIYEMTDDTLTTGIDDLTNNIEILILEIFDEKSLNLRSDVVDLMTSIYLKKGTNPLLKIMKNDGRIFPIGTEEDFIEKVARKRFSAFGSTKAGDSRMPSEIVTRLKEQIKDKFRIVCENYIKALTTSITTDQQLKNFLSKFRKIFFSLIKLYSSIVSTGIQLKGQDSIFYKNYDTYLSEYKIPRNVNLEYLPDILTKLVLQTENVDTHPPCLLDVPLFQFLLFHACINIQKRFMEHNDTEYKDFIKTKLTHAELIKIKSDSKLNIYDLVTSDNSLDSNDGNNLIIDKELGNGNFGTVYSAIEINTDSSKPVYHAVKTITDTNTNKRTTAIEEFKKEINIMIKTKSKCSNVDTTTNPIDCLRRNNILSITSLVQFNGNIAFGMEICNLGSLEELRMKLFQYSSLNLGMITPKPYSSVSTKISFDIKDEDLTYMGINIDLLRYKIKKKIEEIEETQKRTSSGSRDIRKKPRSVEPPNLFENFLVFVKQSKSDNFHILNSGGSVSLHQKLDQGNSKIYELIIDIPSVLHTDIPSTELLIFHNIEKSQQMIYSKLLEQSIEKTKGFGAQGNIFENFFYASLQIQNGLNYLRKLNIRHLDIATRNILCNIDPNALKERVVSRPITFNKLQSADENYYYVNCLLADFGLSQESEPHDQIKDTAGPAIKWCDPRRLIEGTNSVFSDYWSLFCIFDELFFFPQYKQPYPQYKKANLTDYYRNINTLNQEKEAMTKSLQKIQEFRDNILDDPGIFIPETSRLKKELNDFLTSKFAILNDSINQSREWSDTILITGEIEKLIPELAQSNIFTYFDTDLKRLKEIKQQSHLTKPDVSVTGNGDAAYATPSTAQMGLYDRGKVPGLHAAQPDPSKRTSRPKQAVKGSTTYLTRQQQDAAAATAAPAGIYPQTEDAS